MMKKINMNQRVTVYKPQKSYILGGGVIILALIFIFLTLPVIVSGEPVENHKLFGLVGFWVFGIVLIVLPFGFRLEIGGGCVGSRFFGFKVSDVHSSNVQSVEYGNLYRGGIGFGKGLNYSAVINGKRKVYSIGEKFYGKEAVEHAKHTLQSK